MAKLNEPINLKTAFNEYTVDEILGEGGAGRVYGASDESGNPVGIKLLTQLTSDKRKRFKNEAAFLARTRHPHVVPILDQGYAEQAKFAGPFYVMPRFEGSLRGLMRAGIKPSEVLTLFLQILDGVECAHLKRVVHRDLKPENILYSEGAKALCVADFGVASFVEEELLTLVETGPAQRLANFIYAAPEQRRSGQAVTAAADVFALGLMLNEMFTSQVPQGAGHALIASIHPEAGYLDRIVDLMIRQAPAERPDSIARVKDLIQKYGSEAVSRQKISAIDQTVVRIDDVDDPLAVEPPRVVGGDWAAGVLTIQLDKEITRPWVDALLNMGSYSSVMGAGPEAFTFSGKIARVACRDQSAQQVVDSFKTWLPLATQVLHHRLQQEAQRRAAEHRSRLRAEREAEEQRVRVNSSLRF